MTKRTPVQCIDCGALIPTKATGRLPQRCELCRRIRDGRRTADHRRKPSSERDAAMASVALHERFMSKVAVTDEGRWMWRASVDGSGYGKFYVAGVLNQAHRISYELHVGPIPDGLQLDHLCRTHGCVRPDHLEPVTARVNVLRGISPMAIEASQTHCIRGHEFTAENTYVWSGQPNQRKCRTCRSERSQKKRQR